MRSAKRIMWMQNKYKEVECNYNVTDNLIYEDGKVKRYENSKQYIEDTNRYGLNKELEDTKRRNKELTKIANKTVKEELELDKLNKEPNEYQRKIYLLKQMRW